MKKRRREERERKKRKEEAPIFTKSMCVGESLNILIQHENNKPYNLIWLFLFRKVIFAKGKLLILKWIKPYYLSRLNSME